MAAKFPARRPDGTFSIELLLESDHPLDREAVEDWLTRWCSANREWVRKWHGPGHQIVKTDMLRLSDAFIRDPWLEALTGNAISFRLEGTAEAPFWKDWMVKLVEDATESFPGLEFERAKDVDSTEHQKEPGRQ